MSKPLCAIAGPFDTRSGYGEQARNVINHIIELDMYDVRLISLPWGNTPMNVLKPENPKDKQLLDRMLPPPFGLPRQPELYIQIGVPHEFQPQGKFNVGITAGIETTLASVEWIEGCNRMDTVWVTSEHSKRIFENTIVDRKDAQGQHVAQFRITKPIEVLHNCMDTKVFRKIAPKDIDRDVDAALSQVKESFNFLFVGHWLRGEYGEDRKNVGVLIKTFCEAFKDKGPMNRPGLILKTSGGAFSVMDYDEVISKINSIRESVGKDCPNVYLIYGDMTDVQINSLYNHPKVKAHISFTKGEGFGLPLLEATQSQKPLLVSGWSGQLDFLNPEECILLGGELRKIERGSIWPGVLIENSMWFNVDTVFATNAMKHVIKNYDKFTDKAKKLSKSAAARFDYDVIRERTKALLDQYVPKFAMPVAMNLPKLRPAKKSETP